MKRKTLNRIVKEILFEDQDYGIYDKPAYVGAHPDDESDPEFEPTVPDEVPLKPTEMMSTQLADERPPVEDDEYVPTSLSDLSNAASAISQMVPSDQVEYFYKNLHKLLDDAVAKKNESEAPDLGSEDDSDDEENPVEPKNESRKLREADWDSQDPRYGGYDDQEYDEMGMSVLDSEDFPEFEDAAEEMTNPTPGDSGSATFEEIADEFGFAGPPGARQHIDTILKRMNYFAVKLNKGEVEGLQDYAVGEFIDVLSDPSVGMFDPEDVDVLKSQPQSVKELDSFRFFFVAGFVMPAVQELQRQGKKRLESYLESQGVPKELWQTITNQATGGAERNPVKLAKKIGKVAAKLGLSDEEAVKLGDSLEGAFSEMSKMTDPEGGMGDVATNKWKSMSRDKQIKLAVGAMEQTLDELEDMGIDIDDDDNAYTNRPTRQGFGPSKS